MVGGGKSGTHASTRANGSSGNYYYTNFTDKVAEAKISSKAYRYVVVGDSNTGLLSVNVFPHYIHFLPGKTLPGT